MLIHSTLLQTTAWQLKQFSSLLPPSVVLIALHFAFSHKLNRAVHITGAAGLPIRCSGLTYFPSTHTCSSSFRTCWGWDFCFSADVGYFIDGSW